MTTPITHPTALTDQLNAAASHARRVLTDVAHAGHGDLITTPGTGWLADQAADLWAAVANGTARACRHLGPAPTIAHAAVWAPGQLVCAACIPALRPSPVEDATCDRCRRHARRLHAGATTYGPVILAYGLCRSCATATGLANGTTTNTDPAGRHGRHQQSVTRSGRTHQPPVTGRPGKHP